MKMNIRLVSLMAVLAVMLVAGVLAQQASADKAIDPVCGMTVVKANAKATYDYKGTTYYFCNPGCKESFAKDPEKYLAAAKAEDAKAIDPVCGMSVVKANAKATYDYKGKTYYFCCAGCKASFEKDPEKYLAKAKAEGAQAGGMGHMGQMGHMGHMAPAEGRMGRMRGGLMAPGPGRLFWLYGDKVETAVENTKDGAVLKVTSKDPEVVKAIQVHMAEHLAVIKKMKEAPAKAPAPGAAKTPESACCPNCATKK